MKLNIIITSTYHDTITLGPFADEAEARAAVDAWERTHPPAGDDELSFHVEPDEGARG
jgi:hypothetical protein